MKKEIVINKTVYIQGYLQELESILMSGSDDELLHDSIRFHAIERLFQLFVDATVDINHYIIESHKLIPPDNYKGSFIILGEQKILPRDFANKISDSVGLRNAVVHRYEEISNLTILAGIKKVIPEYKEYLKHIVQYVA